MLFRSNPPTPVPEDKEVVSTSQTSEDSAGPRKMYSSSRNSFEKASKVAKPLQSAGLVRRSRSGRPRSKSPPLPATPVLPRSPQIPLLPNDMITGTQYGYRNNHRSQLSTNTSNTDNDSVGSSAQPTSVVDAIAATMIGEWMWKYVRKRKIFSGLESQDLGRYKRWVWLLPYERAVMWSSKRPTSGSTLMGESARKCEYY